MDIIYSKFSNDRRDEYAIVTNILKDEEGNRYIEKLATKPAGQKHISNLSIWEKELKEKYKDTCIRPNEIVKPGDKQYFQFIKGIALDVILDGFLKAGKTDRMLIVLRQYLDMVQKANDVQDFEMTDSFREVFRWKTSPLSPSALPAITMPNTCPKPSRPSAASLSPITRSSTATTAPPMILSRSSRALSPPTRK